jgi:hypothetical protein
MCPLRTGAVLVGCLHGVVAEAYLAGSRMHYTHCCTKSMKFCVYSSLGLAL